jgi:serine/threonine-protein phosphatase 2A regulatory subunit B
MFSSSRGSIKIGDMREAALCDHHTRQLHDEPDLTPKTYFSELIATVTDVEFSHDGRYVIARDYLSVKIWDLAMEGKGPVSVVQVHEQLRPKLSELFESECIFDRFRVSSSRDGRQVLTGSYNNCCKFYDTVASTETTVELSKARPKSSSVRKVNCSPGQDLSSFATSEDDSGVMSDIDSSAIDYSRKVLHCSWHPHEDIVAVAGLNDLFIYSKQNSHISSFYD